MNPIHSLELLTSLEGNLFTIILNRPNVLNAMTVDMFERLQEAIHQAATNEQVGIVLLRGAGGNFCSGADLSVLGSMSTHEQANHSLDIINSLIAELHQMKKPVIAVVEGVAVGAGLNLALHADFVIATHDAVIQEPFVHIGLTTDFGGTYLLPRLVGMAQAKRLGMLGEKINGAEAERIGLIYKSVEKEQLEEEVTKLVSTLNRLPHQAVAKTKEGLVNSLEFSLDEALAWEKESQPGLILHPDFHKLVSSRLSRK
ncbi:enoyl-CoA hydratase/isomerase family protein [Brevibacillus ginsengisoli]|uniref:enoyl-CoA hydratase/isomerase family protein n=1 Tax=Brevibacillus ginsengisoli TaxID=363854 RepID=UPI003CEC29AA